MAAAELKGARVAADDWSMALFRRQSQASTAQPHVGREQRRQPRFKPRGVNTLLGEVLDLSTSGARVFLKGVCFVELNEEFDLLLECPGMRFTVPVRVVWIKSVGVRRHNIGLSFIEPSEQVRNAIASLNTGSLLEAPSPQAFIRG